MAGMCYDPDMTAAKQMNVEEVRGSEMGSGGWMAGMRYDWGTTDDRGGVEGEREMGPGAD